MNEQQQYEKHLAEKLQNVPLPDADQGWQQMRSLLDKELPRSGPMVIRWWLFSLITVAILSGVWLATGRMPSDTKKNGLSDATQKSQPVITGERKKETNIDDSNSTNVNPKNLATETKKDIGLSEEEKQHSITNEEILGNKTGETVTEKNEKENEKIKSLVKRTEKGDVIVPVSHDEKIKAVHGKGSKEKTGKHPDNFSAAGDNTDNGKKNSDRSNANRFNEEKNEAVKRSITTDKNVNEVKNSRDPTSTVLNSGLYEPGYTVVSPAVQIGTFIDPAFLHPMYQDGQKSIPVAQVVSRKGRIIRGKPVNKNITGRSFAVGISLPLSFAVGEQKPVGYNINANANTFTDYMPVPHVQYHLNEKVYLQAELQFLSPQYINPVLMYARKREIPATNSISYNNIYAKKLYYFNLPMEIHYSPFKNFYLGTGLQFSSLISGVALYEERQTMFTTQRDTLISYHYARFRNDSLSNKLQGSEFRLGLDASYAWKQFNFGFRYNQALSNYISLRLTSTSPLIQDKNKSIQLFLRYNIWENRKKTRNSLTFK